MSLCATGIPVSGPPSPRPIRSSARRACARLFSGSTVMKAFSVPCARSIRSRYARVSSTLETSFAARAAPSSLRVAVGVRKGKARLLNDFRNEVQVCFNLGGDRLEGQVPIDLGARVLPEVQGQVPRVGHRLDAAGVSGLQLLDEADDAVQLRLYRRRLRVGDLDPGEVGDAPDVVQAQRHCGPCVIFDVEQRLRSRYYSRA